jgi:hypothetical protein
MKALQCAPAENLLDVWTDPRLALSPAATLAGKVIPPLNEALKTSLIWSKSNSSESGQLGLFAMEIATMKRSGQQSLERILN